MTLKTRLDRAERAASADTQDDYSAAIAIERQRIMDKIAAMPEPEIAPSPEEQERLMQEATAIVKRIVAERKQANEH